MKALVEFVGAGPGAEDLITVRGLRALEQADLVVYAGSLVNPAHLKACKANCTCLDSASMNLGEQIEAMSDAALAGKRVVRLHTGDPAMYGAINEQIRGLAQKGVAASIIPGVSSVFAAAAALGCELTSPDVSQSVVLTRTPGRTPMPQGEDAAAFARTGAMLVFFLSTGKVGELMRHLMEQGGLAEDTPAAIVYRASWPDERILRGTVGDIESLPFIESVRQLRYQLGARNTALVHLTLIPYLAASGELKTKPTQHSVKTLLENGLQPDILVLRTEHPLSAELRRKVALFCNVDANAVMESIDVPTIYEVPLVMHRQHLDEVVLSKLDLPSEQEPDLSSLQAFVDKVKNPKRTIDIALVGKYTELPDAYKSICESFIQAGAVNDCKVKLHYVNSEKIDASNVGEKLGKMAGILVAPGFGNRGIEGKIEAVHFARTHRIPFLGICLGMQCAVIEFARNVLGFKDATSTEMDPATKHPVIDLMEEQKGITAKGGTMRLGAYPCSLEPGSKAAQAYGTTQIQERHRHRYEFNSEYLKDFESHGMKAVGANPDTGLVEVVEIPDHPWFVGTQYHPEYKSTVQRPHPLFVAFVAAALAGKDDKKK